MKNRMKRLLYSNYSVSGLNLDMLINSLRRSGIGIMNASRRAHDNINIRISFCDKQKFFAIMNKLCYNIAEQRDLRGRKLPLERNTFAFIGYSGLLAPLMWLKNNIGIALGALVFALLVYSSSDLILGIEYTGSGSASAAEISAVLDQAGITEWRFAGQFDLKEAARNVRLRCNGVAFAEIYMKGNRLVVETISAALPKTPLDQPSNALLAPCDGKLVKLVVYSGLAVKQVGDSVAEGEIIVEGKYIRGEETFDTSVIASAAVECRYQYDYSALTDSDKNRALALAIAKLKLGETHVNGVFYEVKPTDEGVMISVYLDYEVPIRVGLAD